ncbi:MAG: L-lactate dehydrogenase [Candidatus Magasanikbacteria bacterium RIFCSPHIGHO2_02_FULL_47_14]|uniref:L-lactate dehydrogenase n=1 Tax=Candidatus Magasanikbacteria bacterium RIFCSPHIGHO2_02_FULL_47_14 TaxID=1798680 RepID=A0A1F6MA73_9BACT|nr:MAG: L-lactate dehydrogenase [Candidatus Magasanikbacteria bacterium RIFCSPHIGHO2_02_FULL_47_14]
MIMSHFSPVIAIIGSGAVGSTIAYTLTVKDLASEIMLIDINEQKEQGEVMDIGDAMCFVETGCINGADFKDARRADIIVITAGANQKPGETRLDLVEKNTAIMKSLFKSIGRLKPSTIIIVVTNPVDVLTHVVQKISGLSESHVIGTGTSLDTARLKSTLSAAFGVSSHAVEGFVLGEHGDSEFVAWSSVRIGGVPITQLPGFSATQASAIEDKVKKEAYEIIARKGATFYGIGLITTHIIHAVIHDQKKILPVTTHLKNWNGVSNTFLGAPSVVGKNGVEKIWPLALSKQEQKKLQKSAEAIKKYLGRI